MHSDYGVLYVSHSDIFMTLTFIYVHEKLKKKYSQSG